MRLINADTLLANIHNAMCADCNDECAACQWRDAIKLIEEAPTVGEWINVKDRLPNNRQKVIAHIGNHFEPFDEVVIYAYGYWHQCSEDGGWYLTCDITHWMPSPEPPKEVSGDGQG